MYRIVCCTWNSNSMYVNVHEKGPAIVNIVVKEKKAAPIALDLPHIYINITNTANAHIHTERVCETQWDRVLL